ncbi:hypothetical protein [Silvanigrella aquatica]|uniref:Uncharacterized protein n=1 Tax=Silvanigrella aquatica TaxID=1915309 RepID=A0A1L4D1Q6_9BACT|nr:hypothetical protein [Silvanigrella aquatica]APJ04128.1 hypothetical protein AXG55_09515 [Silvanigrella aquatica]
MKIKVIAIPLLPVSLLFSSLAFAVQSENNSSNKYECQIEFHKGQTEASHEELDQCLNKVPKDENIHFVQIISSADKKGSYTANKKVTDLRLKKTEAYLLKDLKNVETQLISVGKNEQLGRKVHVLFMTEKPQTSLAAVLPVSTTEKPKEVTSLTHNNNSAKNEIRMSDEEFVNLLKLLIVSKDSQSKNSLLFLDKKIN